MFGTLREWIERRRALKVALSTSAEDNQHAFAAFFTEQVHLAKDEFLAERPHRALEIWRGLHARFPDLCVTSEDALNLFIDLVSHREADALIMEARGRHPRYRSLYAAAYARVAYRQGELQEAVRRYEIVRRRFPQNGDGYGIAAACLDALGRKDEAEALLARGVRKLPDNFDLNMRYAQAATLRGDWSEGLKRWNLLWRRFGHLPGPLGAAQCLKELGRFDEAESVLTETGERFSSSVYPFAALAELSTAKGDLDVAARRWEVVLQRFPSFDEAYSKAAEVFGKIGREVDADEVLRAGMVRSPKNLAIALHYARNAHQRGDWAAARDRWAMVGDLFPDCVEAREQEMVAHAALQRQASNASG